MMSSVAELVLALAARPRDVDGRSFVIALDGHSAAGKSTLGGKLTKEMKAAVIAVDDFYRDEPEDVRLSYDAALGVRRYFDWERMVREAILPLRAGVAARYRPFDWQAGHGLGDVVTIEPASVVIVEGVYSARPELRPLLDVAVLVQAPADSRLRRRRERHDAHEWEARWDRAERLYFTTVSPPDSFDFVVSGIEQ